MTKLCKFTLTFGEKVAIQYCLNSKSAIHLRTYNRARYNPAGKATDDQIEAKHYELLQACVELDSLFEKAVIDRDTDQYYYEVYLSEEEQYALMSEAFDKASKRLRPDVRERAENVLTKIAENFT